LQEAKYNNAKPDPHTSLTVSITVLSAPSDAYNYGIGWTDLFAGSAVDAIG